MLLQPKRWDLLAAAFVVMLAGILITLVRWWYLVRSVGISFSLSDAMRIGFLGYLFNLAPMGIVGGDLLKAWMLSREKPGTRARAFASVIVDRIVGLYVLFLVATSGVFVTGFWNLPDRTVHLVCIGVIAITAVCHRGNCLASLARRPGGTVRPILTRIPKIGRAVGSLLEALRTISQQSVGAFPEFLDDDSGSYPVDILGDPDRVGVAVHDSALGRLLRDLSRLAALPARFPCPPVRPNRA